MQTAAYARRIDVVDLGAGVSRAAAWLASAPPARREIVVVSGFQRGAIDDTVIREIPAGIGIRLVQVGGAVESAVVPGVELYGVDRIARRAQSIELTTDTTAVSISEVPGPSQGVRIINPAAPATARPDVDALLKSIAIAGTPAGSPQQPIAIQLDDGGNAGTLAPIRAGWMLQTALRLREDVALARLMANSPARDLATPGPWTILVRNGGGKPTIRAASLGDELLIDVAAPPASFVAASAVRAVLAARAGDVEQPHQEIALMSEAQLSAWNRAPAAVDRDVWRNATSNDARWFWGAALVLLAVEQWLRSRSALGADKETSRAAA